VFTQSVDASQAKFSDFMSVTSVSLAIAGAIFAYFSLWVQAQKNNVDQQTKEYNSSIAASLEQLQAAERSRAEHRRTDLLRLEAPSDRAQVVGPQVALQWSYSGHSDHMNYLVEVLHLCPESEVMSGQDAPCAVWRSCFYAAEPSVQRSELYIDAKAFKENDTATPSASGSPLTGNECNTEDGAALGGGSLAPGYYLWRVAPAKLSQTRDGSPVTAFVSEWSEFQSFAVYPTELDRILRTRRLLIGTAVSADPSFSGRDISSRSIGHDIDLIEILVTGCITGDLSAGIVKYNKARCAAKVESYRTQCGPQSARHSEECFSVLHCSRDELCAKIIPFDSAADGLRALREKDIDVFVGSLTRAEARQEEYGLRFSSGYFSYHTQLYARATNGSISLTEWLTKPRLVGVVAESTNNLLATELASDDAVDGKLSVVAFRSVPELKNAVDQGDVDGVFLDDTLGRRVAGLSPINGINKTLAWSRYRSALGFDRTETFGIAVAVNNREELVRPCGFTEHWLQAQVDVHMFAGSEPSLFCAIEQALVDSYVGTSQASQNRALLKDILRSNYHLDDQRSSIEKY
jgi:ABC-type amino acid transport substrate-binding protein